LEECPKCNKWTLTYNPKSELKTCMNCDYKEWVSYESFIRRKNVIDYLIYPNHERKKRSRKIEA